MPRPARNQTPAQQQAWDQQMDSFYQDPRNGYTSQGTNSGGFDIPGGGPGQPSPWGQQGTNSGGLDIAGGGPGQPSPWAPSGGGSPWAPQGTNSGGLDIAGGGPGQPPPWDPRNPSYADAMGNGGGATDPFAGTPLAGTGGIRGVRQADGSVTAFGQPVMPAPTTTGVLPGEDALMPLAPGVPSVQAPQALAPLAPAPQVQSTPSLTPVGQVPHLSQAALLQALGGVPNVQGAGPASQFGQDVQGSISRDLGPATVDPNDPVMRARLDAFRRTEQRNTDRQRAAEAQRANASGTIGSGGFNTRMRAIDENQGARESDFEANLIGAELDAARARTQQARSLGAGLFSQEQQQDLATRLANQSAGLAGMGLQNTRDLANQGTQQQTGLANQSASLAGLGLQNTRDLASQSLQQQTGLANQNALMQALGLQTQRDLTQQGYGMQAGLANQQAGLNVRGQNLQHQQGMGSLGLQRELGFGNIGLQRELGLGDLGARNRSLDIQQQLGLGDLGVRRDSLGLQRELGFNDQILRRNALNLQRELGLSDLDLRRLGLTNQNEQYYAGLGQQLGLSQAQMNQQALLSLLGGF